MRSYTPQGDPPGSARSNRRSSVSNSTPHLRSSSGSGVPRPQTTLRESRIGTFRPTSSTQPSYNLLTGEPSSTHTPQSVPMNRSTASRQSLPATGPSPPPPPPPARALHGRVAAATEPSFSRESSKENMAPPDADEYEAQRRRIEELKAEVGALRYAVSSREQEAEMARLQTEGDLRDARRRAEEDFKARQAAEAERGQAERRAETVRGEMDSLRGELEAQRREAEARAREAQEEARVLREQMEELRAAKDDEARLAERAAADLRNQVASAQRAVQELEQEARTREEVLEKTQALLAERDDSVSKLEADVLRLKATMGDAETVAVIRRELSDQVTHIRALEATNREQLIELKHLRQVHKAVEVVEEEKRSILRRLDAAASLQTEIEEERRQRQRLEDERRSWTAYLQRESGGGGHGDQAEFESPEDVARALVRERLNSAALVEKLGELQPELSERDNIIQSLEKEKAALQSQVETLKTSGASTTTTSADKARARIERQRVLAVKEVEYLRAQLKTFDAEDLTFQPESFDRQKAQRIQELEDLVDKYKTELQTLTSELESASATASPMPLSALFSLPTSAGTKRPRGHEKNGDDEEEAESEQLGQLIRKNRKLQGELSELQNAHQLLQTEHSVTVEQLAAAREQLKTRILSLRSNPTADHEATKAATLAALRRENAELVAHVQQRPGLFATVPASQLAAAQRAVEEAQAETASAHKSARRLKEVWAAKSGEFKEAVFSTLGWTVSFLPGGKMRVESVYHPSLTEEHENSIVFDGERGTMKVGGGPRSAFATRIADNIKFWVRERGCVPCFLAALTLEFYEEHTRAARPV